MKQGSTLILRGVVIFIGLIVLVLCAAILPQGIRTDNAGDYRPILIGLYIPAVPFFFALFQALNLLDYIDKNRAFSLSAVKALRQIKYCALIICGLFALGMPYIFHVADQDDAPGVALIGFIIIGASFVIAAFAGVLEKLLQNAIEIKSENDLTV